MESTTFSRLLGLLCFLNRKHYNGLFHPLGLKANDLPFLLILQNGERPQSQLADLLVIDKSNVTRRLTILEHLGYVNRRKKGRDQFVSLTNQGRALVPQIKSQSEEWIKTLTQNLDTDAVETAKRVLSAMVDRGQELLDQREKGKKN